MSLSSLYQGETVILGPLNMVYQIIKNDVSNFHINLESDWRNKKYKQWQSTW